MLEGRFSDSLAAASRREGVICIVDILCLAVQGNLIFFLVFLFMIELLQTIKKGLIALFFGKVLVKDVSASIFNLIWD